MVTVTHGRQLVKNTYKGYEVTDGLEPLIPYMDALRGTSWIGLRKCLYNGITLLLSEAA